MKQIAERCGLYGVKDYDNTISEDVSKVRLDKFAELIVQECIDALWTEECHTSDLAVEDYNRNCRKIKEHFISRHNIIVVIQSRRRSKNDISTKSSS